MKLKNLIAFIGILIIGILAGCGRIPVQPRTLITANSNETMFVIPLQGENKANQAKLDSASYYSDKKVSVKEIEVNYRWLQTGRWECEGSWVPTVSIIKVDRSPVTVELAVNDKGNAKKDADAIWIESSDSVGFTMGFSVSALIDEADTATFLYRYPAGNLRNVIVTEIRAMIQESASGFAAKYPLDVLRGKKNEMLTVVKGTIVDFYKTRGITITTVGMFGGMTYENPQIQAAIDKVFIAQQEKETAKAALDAVNDINKRSESLAQQEKANAVTLATGKAEAVRLEADAVAKGNLLKSQADASGIDLIAKATQAASSNPLFLEVRKLEVQTKMYEKWAGGVPSTVIAGSGVTPNIFLPNSPASASSVK
jgi:hypothetical protein